MTIRSFRKREKYLALLPFAAAAILCLGWVFRPLWFDEALTVMEFMTLTPATDIYWHYNIPNNHILFTFLLRGWSELTALSGVTADFILRGLPLLITAAAVITAFFCWKRRGGIFPSTLVLLVFVLSKPFEIYAPALRGYMLSFLLVVLGLECFRRRQKTRQWFYLLLYFVIALAAMATIPSNLIAFAAIALYFLPNSPKRIFYPGYLGTALLPIAAFGCVYLPIWPKLLHNLALKEGWSDTAAAVSIVYGGWLYAMLPVILLALVGLIWRLCRRKFSLNLLARLSTFLLPLALWPFLHPYPFPRVFFCLWPVWLLILIPGIRLALAGPLRLTFLRRNELLLLLLGLVMGWSWCSGKFSAPVSALLVGEKGLDDYFKPYYLGSYDPTATVTFLKEDSGPVYVSFAADRYPLFYYGAMQRFKADRWLYDRPGHQLEALPNRCLVVLAAGENPDAVRKRFGGEPLTRLKNNGYQIIYEYIKQKNQE